MSSNENMAFHQKNVSSNRVVYERTTRACFSKREEDYAGNETREAKCQNNGTKCVATAKRPLSGIRGCGAACGDKAREGTGAAPLSAATARPGPAMPDTTRQCTSPHATMRVSPSALLRAGLLALLLLLALATPLRAQMDGVDNDWAPETVVRVLQEANDADGPANARARASANARAAASASSESDSAAD